MKKIMVLVVMATVLYSCGFNSGSGNIVSEKRSTGSFKSISVGQGFEVEVRPGPVHDVVIEADDNFIEDVETTVEKGVLKIKLDRNSIRDAHLKAFITVPSIESIKTSSAASVVSMDEFHSDKTVSLNASSGSSIDFNIDAPQIKASGSSGSEIILKGRTRNLEASSSSGASIKASDLLSENTKVKCSSGSSALVHASVLLNATASSGSQVKYTGGAKVESNVSSGGGVSRED